MLRAAAAASLLLTTPAVGAPADEYANIRTIGIVSTVGDTFVLKRVGLTVFGNSERTVPIAWGVDDLLTKDLTESLSQRFTVKPVTFNSDKLKNCRGWEDCVSLLPSNPDIDAYVFVREATGYLRGDALDPYGIGIYRKELPFMDDSNLLHAFYRVDVVNAKTGGHIDYGTGRVSETDAFGDHIPPQKVLQPAPLPNSDSKLTPEKLDSYRPTILDMIQASYMRALINANLLPESADPDQK